MKRIICLITGCIIVFSVHSQSVGVVAASGSNNGGGTGSLYWTIGMPVVGTMKSGDRNLLLTQGAEGNISATVIREESETGTETDVSLFPNPAGDFINIRLDTPAKSEMKIVLVDSRGNTIKDEIIEPEAVFRQLDIQNIPPGIYFLRITAGSHTKIFKVVKL